jgi:hypothetical protein
MFNNAFYGKEMNNKPSACPMKFHPVKVGNTVCSKACFERETVC